jgi:hypothetical protein
MLGKTTVRVVPETKIAVVAPVLDDWPVLGRRLQEISVLADDLPFALEIVVVDHGSSVSYELHFPTLTADAICGVEILRLRLNLGHQRALAIGLVEIAGREDLEGVFVMGCHGGDRPPDLALQAGKAEVVTSPT